MRGGACHSEVTERAPDAVPCDVAVHIECQRCRAHRQGLYLICSVTVDTGQQRLQALLGLLDRGGCHRLCPFFVPGFVRSYCCVRFLWIVCCIRLRHIAQSETVVHVCISRSSNRCHL